MCPIIIVDGNRYQTVTELEEVCPRGIALDKAPTEHDKEGCLCNVAMTDTASLNGFMGVQETIEPNEFEFVRFKAMGE